VVAPRLFRSRGVLSATVSGAPIATLTTDPMPATLRLGQHLFHSANSDEYPITKNHWVACASCHPEARSDEVVWRFDVGPRDTPTNGGGILGTGFLLRTADRAKVEDYWRTINEEQGGSFDPFNPQHVMLLTAIEQYVNHAVPFPVPPTTDANLVAQGATVFVRTGCTACHSGPRFTDSGSGNPTLDLSGPVLLHNVGTCATDDAVYPDIAHLDIEGHPRDACVFDTPSLRGIASDPPYMHDGSSPTIRDAAERMVKYLLPNGPALSADDEAALVEYLRSL
jgi:cytochrome c peroxidase